MGEVTKNFSKEDEELIRKFLFTNPHGKDSFIYPQQLFSGEEFSPIISEYSRTHKSLQDRVLSYLDKEKLEETRALLPMMPKLMEITRNPDGSLLSTKKIESFNRLWILRKGHMSAKELTGFVGYSEDISDLVDKHITGHPLVSPLVKSTRYLPFDKVIGMEDPDISNLPQPEQYYEYIAYMGKRYQETTKALTDFVMGHKYTNEVIGYLNRPENLERAVAKWAEEQQFIRGSPVSQKELSEQKERILKGLQDEKVREEIQGFVLDYSRVYLLSSIKNSLGYALDARALAEVISSMVSSPRIEDRTRGQAIWDEAKKIAPVLFGSPDSIKLSKNQDLSSWAKENVQIVYHGDDRKMTTIYSPHFFDGNLDSLNLAMALFPHMEASFYAINYSLRDLDTTKLFNKLHENGRLNQDISYSLPLVEIILPWHAYRDIYRHRRGQHTRQLLTTRLGYEIPEIFDMAGLTDRYVQDMEKAKVFYERARKIDPLVAEKLVPFGFNVRALHSWPINQIVYVANQRGNYAAGNRSYVGFARDLISEARRIFPNTLADVKVDTREYPAELWKRGYEWWDTEGKAKYATFK